MFKKVLIINGVERTLVLEGTETLAKVLRERSYANKLAGTVKEVLGTC